MRKKVSIIGAGNVGATTAMLLAHMNVADIMLVDIVEGVPQGRALDIAESCPLYSSSVSVTGSNGYEDTAESDVLVVTAGFPRKPGMSRDDLLKANAEIVGKVAEETVKQSAHAVIIVVTNPMDAMAQLVLRVSGFPESRVVGMGGVLDSARFRRFVAWEMGVSPGDVEALVMGGHGSGMVPLPRFTTVKGVPITSLLSPERVAALIERTRKGGDEIVSHLKTGSAFYAPAASVCQMIKSIICDEKRVLPCSAYLRGQYGFEGVYAGVPVVLASSGVERIIELELEEAEKKDFGKSVSSVSALVKQLGLTGSQR
ncbi:MAG: malate dehydrogenase [Candidatus Sulfobium sp.]